MLKLAFDMTVTINFMLEIGKIGIDILVIKTQFDFIITFFKFIILKSIQICMNMFELLYCSLTHFLRSGNPNALFLVRNSEAIKEIPEDFQDRFVDKEILNLCHLKVGTHL